MAYIPENYSDYKVVLNIKVHKGWKFEPEDLMEYVKHRLNFKELMILERVLWVGNIDLTKEKEGVV